MRASRRLLLRHTAMLAGVGLGLRASSVFAHHFPMTLAVEDSPLPPYLLGAGESLPERNPGIAVELVSRVVANLTHLKLSYVRQPWQRCLDDLARNAVDGVMLASYQPARAAIGRYPMKAGVVDTSRRLATMSYSLYSAANATIAWDGKAFQGADNALIVAPSGYSIATDLRNKGLRVAELNNTPAALQQVLGGHADAAALLDVAADPLLTANPALNSIRKHAMPLASKAYYLLLSYDFVHRRPADAEAIWDGIGRLREAAVNTLAPHYRD